MSDVENKEVEAVEADEPKKKPEPKKKSEPKVTKIRYFIYKGNTVSLPSGTTLVPNKAYREDEIYVNGKSFQEGVDSPFYNLDVLLGEKILRHDPKFKGMKGVISDYNNQPFKISETEENFYHTGTGKLDKRHAVGIPRIETTKAILITRAEYDNADKYARKYNGANNIPRTIM